MMRPRWGSFSTGGSSLCPPLGANGSGTTGRLENSPPTPSSCRRTTGLTSLMLTLLHSSPLSSMTLTSGQTSSTAQEQSEYNI